MDPTWCPGQLDRKQGDRRTGIDVLDLSVNAKFTEGLQQLLGLIRNDQTAVGFVNRFAFFKKIELGELPLAVVLHLWWQRRFRSVC